MLKLMLLVHPAPPAGPHLPPPRLQVLSPAAVRAVHINPAILGMYLDHLLPEIAAPGDDHNYGSSAMNTPPPPPPGGGGGGGGGGPRRGRD